MISLYISNIYLFFQWFFFKDSLKLYSKIRLHMIVRCRHKVNTWMYQLNQINKRSIGNIAHMRNNSICTNSLYLRILNAMLGWNWTYTKSLLNNFHYVAIIWPWKMEHVLQLNNLNSIHPSSCFDWFVPSWLKLTYWFWWQWCLNLRYFEVTPPPSPATPTQRKRAWPCIRRSLNALQAFFF